jgi:chemotaxis protein histidine kinase CheA
MDTVTQAGSTPTAAPQTSAATTSSVPSIDYSLTADADDLLRKFYSEDEVKDALKNADENGEEDLTEKPKAKKKAKAAEKSLEEDEESEESEDEADEQSDDEDNQEDSEEEEETSFELNVNGEKKIVSAKEALALAQKGLDYTQKTQQLSQAKQEFDSQLKQAAQMYESAMNQFATEKQQMQADIDAIQKWNYFMENLERTDNDAYVDLKQRFDSTVSTFDNPIVNQQISQLKQEIAMLRQQTMQGAGQQQADAFNRRFKEFHDSMNVFSGDLGNSVDWNRVYQMAGGNPDAIEPAFYASYGPAIRGLYESKKKMQALQGKIKAKRSSTISGGHGKGSSPKESFGKMSYQNIADTYLNGGISL